MKKKPMKEGDWSLQKPGLYSKGVDISGRKGNRKYSFSSPVDNPPFFSLEELLTEKCRFSTIHTF